MAARQRQDWAAMFQLEADVMFYDTSSRPDVYARPFKGNLLGDIISTHGDNVCQLWEVEHYTSERTSNADEQKASAQIDAQFLNERDERLYRAGNAKLTKCIATYAIHGEQKNGRFYEKKRVRVVNAQIRFCGDVETDNANAPLSKLIVVRSCSPFSGEVEFHEILYAMGQFKDDANNVESAVLQPTTTRHVARTQRVLALARALHQGVGSHLAFCETEGAGKQYYKQYFDVSVQKPKTPRIRAVTTCGRVYSEQLDAWVRLNVRGLQWCPRDVCHVTVRESLVILNRAALRRRCSQPEILNQFPTFPSEKLEPCPVDAALGIKAYGKLSCSLGNKNAFDHGMPTGTTSL